MQRGVELGQPRNTRGIDWRGSISMPAIRWRLLDLTDKNRMDHQSGLECDLSYSLYSLTSEGSWTTESAKPGP